MNKRLQILLGVALIFLPIIILLKLNVFKSFIEFFLYSISLIVILVGIVIIILGISDLKDSIKNKIEEESQNVEDVEVENISKGENE